MMTVKLRLMILAIFSILSVNPAISSEKIEEHISFKVNSGHIINKNGKNWFAAVIEADIEKGWHLYWNKVDDVGLPSKFKVKKKNNINKIDFFWPTPTRKTANFNVDEDVESLESFVYENQVSLPILVLPVDDQKNADAEITLQYAICNDICISNEVTLNVNLKSKYIDPKFVQSFEDVLKTLPKHIDESPFEIKNAKIFKNQDGTGVFIIKLHSENKEIYKPDLAIKIGSESVFAKPQIYLGSGNIIKIISKFNPDNHRLKLNSNDIVDVSGNIFYNDYNKSIKFEKQLTIKDYSSNENNTHSIKYIILIAIIGGIILNFMPCVLPVLSIKLLSILNNSFLKPSQIRSSFLMTSFGIIFSFLVLAALSGFLKFSGNEFNYGFQFQQPIFIITMVIIMVIFISNLLGHFEINLPHKFMSKLNKIETGSAGNYLAKSFLSGMLATILATPCSAPFVGTSITFALSRSYYEIMLIFGFMGFGMSMPFILFAIFPKLVNLLPKPGAWMFGFKKLLAVLLILTMLWLIFILSNQIGTTAAFIFFAMIILLKFTINQKNSVTKKVMLLIIISLCYFLPHFYYTVSLEEDARIVKIWHKFEEKKISQLVASGKVVIIDVTSDWCINCKLNKFMVLDREFIQKYLLANDVYPMRSDITKPKPHINKYMQKYNKFGIPFNIIYGPNAPSGIILPELITTSDFLQAFYKARGN